MCYFDFTHHPLIPLAASHTLSRYNHCTTPGTTASPQNFVPPNKLPGHIPYPTPGAVSPHVRYEPYSTTRKSTTSNAATSANLSKTSTYLLLVSTYVSIILFYFAFQKTFVSSRRLFSVSIKSFLTSLNVLV